MKIRNFYKVIDTYLKSKNDLVPLYIIGNPGIGKTEIIKEYAFKNNYEPIIINSGSKTIEHFSGLPEKMYGTLKDNKIINLSDKRENLNNNEKTLMMTKWTASELISMCKIFPRSVVFIDDFHLASSDIRKIFFSLLTDREIHGYVLPEETKIILAGNPQEDIYGAEDSIIPLPLISRLCIINLEVDFEAWIEKSVANNINPIITSFLNFNDTVFITKPDIIEEDSDVINMSYACPRSWWNLSNYIKYYGIDKDLVIGLVGKKAGSAFLTFYKIFQQFEEKLPNTWESLKSFQDKCAFSSYLVLKKDVELLKKYLPDMNKDKEISMLNIMVWSQLLYIENEDIQEYMNYFIDDSKMKKIRKLR